LSKHCPVEIHCGEIGRAQKLPMRPKFDGASLRPRGNRGSWKVLFDLPYYLSHSIMVLWPVPSIFDRPGNGLMGGYGLVWWGGLVRQIIR